MKNAPALLIGLIIGTFLGGVVALLFTPQSGEELRTLIRDEAQKDRQRLQAQYEKSRQDLQSQVEKMKTEMGSRDHQSEGQAQESAEIV